MKQSYDDILARIAEAPTWWDVYGVPRYGDPPEELVPFMREIRCQNCWQRFRVALVEDVYYTYRGHERSMVRSREVPDDWHYGDPPRHPYGKKGDCMGETMNSIPEYEWGDPEWKDRASE